MVEVINARLDDGAWRSVKPYKTHPTVAGDHLFVHVLEDRENFIWWDHHDGLLAYTDETGATFPIYDCVSTDFVFAQYKNILIVSSVTDMYRKYCIWEPTLNTYQVVDMVNVDIDLRFFGVFMDKAAGYGIGVGTTYPQYVHCNTFTEHQTAVTARKEHGFFYGELLVCCAIETIYGEVIKHGPVQFVSVGLSGIVGEVELGWTSKYDFEIGFLAGIFKSNVINDSFFSNIEIYRKVISSVNIYVSDIQHANYSEYNNTIGEDYDDENFVKNAKFYLAYKYSIDELKAIGKDSTFMVWMNQIKDFEPGSTTIQWPGDLTDMATRDEMPVDNFSHHVTVERNNHMYNNRLLIMNTKAKLKAFIAGLFSYPEEAEQSNPHWSELGSFSPGTPIANEYDVFSVVKLKTADGIKVVESDVFSITSWWNTTSSPPQIRIIFNRMLSFPDSRAFEIQVYIRHTNTLDPFVNILRTGDFVPMKSSSLHNFSYVPVNKNIIGGILETIIKNHFIWSVFEDYAFFRISELGGTHPSHTVNDIVNDPNRVQASAPDNVFYFPAINSYQVGNSRVLAISENALPVSTGQFGSYPLIVFTESGIWSMNIDPSGQLFVTSITPISDDRLSDAASITKAGNLILFATAKGVAAMAGQDIKYISALIDGVDYKNRIHSNTQFTQIAGGANFGAFFNLLTTTRLSDYIGGITGIGGITSCIMGFDSIKKELIVCNEAFNYSWVYSFESQLWTKRSIVYKKFLYGRNRTYAHPKGVLSNLPLYILGEETTQALTGDYSTDSALFSPMVFITQPFQCEAADIYSKITQLFVDGAGIVAGNKYAGLFLFSSVDGETWYMNAGVDIAGTLTEKKWRNMEVKHSGFSAKYHVIVFCGPMADVYISPEMEVSFEEKYTRRSR